MSGKKQTSFKIDTTLNEEFISCVESFLGTSTFGVDVELMKVMIQRFNKKKVVRKSFWEDSKKMAKNTRGKPKTMRNISLDSDVNEEFSNRCKEAGISQGAVVMMLMYEFKNMNDGVKLSYPF